MGLVPKRTHSGLGGGSCGAPEAAPLFYLVGLVRVQWRSQSLPTKGQATICLVQPLANQIPLELSEIWLAPTNWLALGESAVGGWVGHREDFSWCLLGPHKGPRPLCLVGRCPYGLIQYHLEISQRPRAWVPCLRVSSSQMSLFLSRMANAESFPKMGYLLTQRQEPDFSSLFTRKFHPSQDSVGERIRVTVFIASCSAPQPTR